MAERTCVDCGDALRRYQKSKLCEGCRFWSHVEKTDTCWRWTGYAVTGYGRFRTGSGLVLAHRYAWELLVGPIPDGLQIDHLCRVRCCVSPAHLEPVTQRENWLRGDAPSAGNARKTHCILGHEFTPENTRVRDGNRDGHRDCRECDRVECRQQRRQRRLAQLKPPSAS